MQVLICGQNIENGESLTEYSKDKIEQKLAKFSLDLANASTTFSKVKAGFFSCRIVLSNGRLFGEGKSGDIYRSFDKALDRLIMQVKKIKEKSLQNSKDTIRDTA